LGRVYAGILSPIAVLAFVLRSFRYDAGVDATLLGMAIVALAFAALGYVLGELAGWVVVESVRSQMASELARQDGAADKTSDSK